MTTTRSPKMTKSLLLSITSSQDRLSNRYKCSSSSNLLTATLSKLITQLWPSSNKCQLANNNLFKASNSHSSSSTTPRFERLSLSKIPTA